MAARFVVRLTQGAEGDLKAIVDYVAAHGSPEVAAGLLEELLGRIDTLERFPLRGAVPNELEALGIAEFRQLVVPPYRVIYRILDQSVFVMIIAHGRRDMQALLERRLLGR